MQFSTQRSDLLTALQSVIGVVERKQTMPILSSVLIDAHDEHLVITATDLELELVTRCPAEIASPGAAAVPARKLFDICRGLHEGAELTVDLDEQQVRVRSGRARFLLSYMPKDNWPKIEDIESETQFEISEGVLKQLLHKTAFAMAVQDVRFYLNGLLFVFGPQLIRCVATDGHRLALSEAAAQLPLTQTTQAIVPRKAVNELTRLLADDGDNQVSLQLARNHMRFELPGLQFTSKLIDGRFPDYERVIPQDNNNCLTADREAVRQALSRAAILSSEKIGGVQLSLQDNVLGIRAQNADREVAEDEISVAYEGDQLAIGFNVHYLLDVLSVLSGEKVVFHLADENSSGLIQDSDNADSRFVVMPMRL